MGQGLGLALFASALVKNKKETYFQDFKDELGRA